MGKINILSSKVFNRIAAGEVIERPYSVVKELVENSIDAGASNIYISIENGGLSSIKIIDNGVGILKDDLINALMPHATSKILNVSDLDDIKTLGFRGEALPSIASISKIKISSKPTTQEMGAEIYAEGDKIFDIKESPCINGTEIIVENLFFNTPVRAKFLKSEKSEENDIYSTILRFILGNPNISFKLDSNGKTIIQSFGDGYESAFVSVYGTETIKNCFYIETEKNGIKICGYIGKQNFTKPNRSHQTVFLNGRYVANQTISSSISNAYASYLMKRQYPFYSLKIEIPSSEVDVNVHPNKIDVRFINNQVVYGTIYSVISKVLDGTKEALSIVSSEQGKTTNNIENTNKNNNDYVRHNEMNFDFNKLVFNDNITEKAEIIEKKISENKKPEIDIFSENKKFLEELEKKKEQENKAQTEIIVQKDLKLIGQVLNTFLIFEDGTDLYFIDQHAAHERIMFDKIVESFNDKTVISQPLLMPYVLSLNSEEFDFILNKTPFFKEMGFEIDEIARNTLRVSSIPAYLSNADINKFFDSVLEDMNSLKKLTVKDILFDKIAQKACKSAIKSGDKMSDNEIEELIRALKCDFGLKCPHGRPIAIKITRTEIDKWFKRIV